MPPSWKHSSLGGQNSNQMTKTLIDHLSVTVSVNEEQTCGREKHTITHHHTEITQYTTSHRAEF